MSVPYVFSTQTAPIPLNELDTNFNTTINLGTTTFQLGDTVPGISGLSSLDATAITTTDLNVNGTLTGGNSTIYGFYGASGNPYNFAAGSSALSQSTANNKFSTAIGYYSMGATQSGQFNTAIGYQSMSAIGMTSNYCTALGANALRFLSSGSYNVGIGYDAGSTLDLGSGNTIINPQTSAGATSPCFAVSNQNDRVVMGSTAVTNAYVKVAWTVTSDARDKINFSDVPHGLDFVSKLEPISYQFKISRDNDTPHGGVRYGFKAQDVLALEGSNPVIIDAEDLDSLKFNSDSLIPVLVNAIKELKNELDLLKLKVGA